MGREGARDCEHRTDHVEIPTRMLVHALIREDGTVGADELYSVATTLGMSDQQVRLCVKRLVAESRPARHEGRGRRAELHATADTAPALAPNADFLRHAFRQDAGLAPWDGVWHLAAFAVPESARGARDALRETLVHLGGAPLQGELYVCGQRLGAEYVKDAAHRLGAQARSPSSARRISAGARPGAYQNSPRRLWLLEEIADRYHRLSPYRPAPPRPAHRPCRTLTVRTAHHRGRAGRRTRPGPWSPIRCSASATAPALARTQARELVARCWAALVRTTSDGEARPTLFRLYADITREAADRATR